MTSDIRVFNQQLLLVLRAGVPLAIGDRATISQIEKFLSGINDRFQNPNDAYSKVSEQILNDERLPLDYRNAVRAWSSGDPTVESAQAFFECGKTKSEIRWSITKVLLPFLLMLWLVTQGMTFLVRIIYPELNDLYQISNRSPSASLRFLAFLNEYSWVGNAVALSFMIATILLWFRVPSWLLRSVPMHSMAIRSLRKAQQLEREVRQSKIARPDKENSTNWASDLPSRIRMNELSAALYRESNGFTTRQWLSWFPIFVGTLLGGLLVLGYVLCLFSPLVDLLHQLARP